MTGKEAMEFHEAEYRKLRLEKCGSWDKPITQRELNIQAYEALVEKIKSEYDLEMAKKYLETSYKFTP